MNVTELARILKVTPKELREKLPRIGFDVGEKAIKVDNKLAQRIIKEWAKKTKELEKKDEEERKKEEGGEEEVKQIKKVSIPSFITVNQFANLSELPVSRVLKELMKNGIFASINEKIDFETANIIGDELGLDVKLNQKKDKEDDKDEETVEKILKEEEEENLKERPPVVVVMGHVDHGKTKLLDTIRESNIAGEESGGITQHIGAYQAIKNDRLITFIDTPGHEAFTAMRSRGAKVADIAILIVAADDGVKPQTLEAFKIIGSARIPYLVAMNKIDKEGADINKTKQELSSQLKIVPEDWGGKIICSPISAKNGDGVQALLDMILLLADTESKDLTANPNTDGMGTIIESHLDKSSGPVATILIQNGTLRVGDRICLRNQICGKIRALENYKGEKVESATPSTPVKIIGLKISPSVGDILKVNNQNKSKISKIKKRRPTDTQSTPENENEDIKKLNLIIKSDFLGSAEAIEESLMKINTEDVKVKIIHKGLGNIREGDILKAEAGGAQIIGFNVKASPQIEGLIREKDVKLNNFNIIYELIEYITTEMQKLIQPTTKREDLGRLKVLAVFRTEKGSQIVGGKILEGELQPNVEAEIIRGKDTISQGKITELKIGKNVVKIAERNQECGIKYEGTPEIEEGDILNIYREIEIINKL